jgi:Asp-tRNA(Asn)/Glu-tRNA(Gln) amidotransferase C subunit
MVELPKLKSNITNETVDMVYRLFFDTSNVIGMIEKNEKVNLTKIRKGVENMIDYEERTKIREDKAYKNGTQQGILEAAKNLINSMHREKEDIAYNKLIKRAELLLNLDKSIVDELNKEYL